MLASWNRSLELAYFNQYLMTKVNKEKQVNWLLVDLGLEEKVAEDHINQVLDCMLIGFNRLFKYKCIKQASLGYFRMLDIWKSGDGYHPRIHILLPTIKSYFQGRYYIKYDNWISLWSKALSAESNVSVKVKVINDKVDNHAINSKMKKGILAFHDVSNKKTSTGKNTLIASRRLIGYSRLLKEVMDETVAGGDFALDLDQLCIEDTIANAAFENMIEWHPGVRSENRNPFFQL
ncbi:protein rep [Paenibacillus larvae]